MIYTTRRAARYAFVGVALWLPAPAGKLDAQDAGGSGPPVAEVVASTPLDGEKAGEFMIHNFEALALNDGYFSEGAHAGDIDGDGIVDVVSGPYWYAGPDFTAKQEIYPPVPQNRDRYADNFFSWVYDFNGDGNKDVFVVGFPGTPAYVYANPGPRQLANHWVKHEVFDWVSNESPQFTNIYDDERPELICTRDGFFGFATIDWDDPWRTWSFHPISDKIAASRFGHGLGVGDVNGDGLLDIIHAGGWFEQPVEMATSRRWVSHAHAFSTSYGGADMFAYDVDGDGLNDIITSDAAHDFGLGWYRQTIEDGKSQFEYQQIMGSHPSENKYGILFSELHSVGLADIDGDGLRDIVTGKTYYSHHQQSPMWDAGAVVYWFRLTRGEEGVDWVPYRADGEAGIGRQLTTIDINGDDQLDFVVGGMKGVHVLLQRRSPVTEDQWLAAQPKLYTGPQLPSIENAVATRGPQPEFTDGASSVAGVIEGESLQVAISSGSVGPQAMANFRDGRWSGDSQLFWNGGQPGDIMTIELPAQSQAFNLEIVMTCARDYAIVQLALDGKSLDNPLDLYEPKVTTTGVLKFTNLAATDKPSKLTIQIAGANPQAKPAHMVGIDYLKITPN
ncbi:FG-GAP repeat domain-containing protein [Planctomycetaceae bacterium SH139]